MSKFCLAILFIVAFLSSSIIGTWISGLTLPSVIAIDIESLELQLQFLDGTPVEHFGWGEFSKGQTKQLEGQLVYLGTLKAEVIWNTTDFPFGWSIEVWDASEEKIKEWPAEKAIKLIPGETFPIRIVLREINGILDQLETFSLNFICLGKTKK